MDIDEMQKEYEIELYESFKKQLIEEGFIEANPKRWQRPTRNEIYNLFKEKLPLDIQEDRVRNMSTEFYDYWDGLDWFRKKTRMKSYKGSISTWIGNNYENTGSNSQRFNGESAADKTAASIANRNR